MNRPQPSASGELRKTPLAHVVIYAVDKKLSGTFEFAAPNGSWVMMSVAEGWITKIRCSDLVSPIGRILVDRGYASEDTLVSLLQEAELHSESVGKVAIRRNVLDDAKLEDCLRFQVLQKLRHTFTMPDATTYAYYDAVDLLRDYCEPLNPAVDPYPALFRGLCDAPLSSHVDAALSRLPGGVIRFLRGVTMSRFAFDSSVAAAVECLRVQPMTVDELIGLGMLTPRVSRLLAYLMVITRHVELSTATVAANDRPSSPRVMAAAPASGGPPPSMSFSSPAVPPPSGTMPKAAPVGGPPPAPKSAGQRGALIDSSIFDLGGGAPVDDVPIELRERRDQIVRRSKSVDSEDYFSILGVPKGASPADVRAAYFELVKVWHPDRLNPKLSKYRDQCAHVFSRIGEAHSSLIDPDKREGYMRLIKEGGATPDEQHAIASVLEAATLYQRAEFFLKKSDLAQAEDCCKKARELDPKPADYPGLLAWIECVRNESATPQFIADRILLIDRAIEASPNSERHYLHRGLLFKRLNKREVALKDFKKVVELDPRNVDAVRELRLYEMRKSRPDEPPPSSPSKVKSDQDGGGLLGKLFKKA